MRRLTRHLYFWVLLAILAGGTLGYIDPKTAVKLKPLVLYHVPLVLPHVTVVVVGGTDNVYLPALDDSAVSAESPFTPRAV